MNDARRRRPYILAWLPVLDPSRHRGAYPRIARPRTISHAGMSWVNVVDLPDPGGMLQTTHSRSSVASSSTTIRAASACHGLDSRPK